MESLPEVQVPCLSPDQLVIAMIVLSPDMDAGERVESAPIVSIDPGSAAENGETVYQLRENGRYEYEVQTTDRRDLRLRCTIARRRRNLKPGAADAGRIETGSFCGTLLLEIVEGEANDLSKSPLASALIDVRSIKLEYRSEYRGMLQNLSGRMADLIADVRSSAKYALHSTFEERADEGWFQVQLELLRSVIESREFSAAVQRIIFLPHERMAQMSEQVPIERPFKWTPQTIRAVINSPIRREIPIGHPLQVMTGLGSVAAQVPIVRKIPTVDTPENRFIKHALLDFHGFLARAQQLFGEADGNWSAAAETAKRLSVNLEQWLSQPFFIEIGNLDVLPLGSPTMQRRAGYREILRWWLRFRTAAELSWHGGEELFFAGQRNVAELYEYWLFFALLDWFCGRFDRNGQQPLIEQLVEGLDGESPNLRLRKRIPLGPFTGTFSNTRRRLHASLSYNQEFFVTHDRGQAGSWTRRMHPDYTLTFWPAIERGSETPADAAKESEKQELLVHIHFDAKYRVDNIDALFGKSDSDEADEEDAKSPGNYKRQDLLKMHAYRDAIKRSEGAYILYPGDDNTRRAQHLSDAEGRDRWQHTMRGFHEILPGLGAFAVVPDANGNALGLDHVAEFLDEVLENLCNRASDRERRTADLYKILRERRALRDAGDLDDAGKSMLEEYGELDEDGARLPASPDIMVLLGWCDSDAVRDWMLHNQIAVFQLGDRVGSLPLIKSLSAASHILLRGPDYQVYPNQGLLSIRQVAGAVWTSEELRLRGFPFNPQESFADVFAAFFLEPDNLFDYLPGWDGHKLENALKRFATRQKRAYKAQLEEFARNPRLPQLVSLADLEVALQESDV